MSDIGDLYGCIKEEKQKEAAQRRSEEFDRFQYNAALARCSGFRLACHSETHYTLADPVTGWRYELYPGNQRIWTDPKRAARAPFLTVPRPWRIVDAIKSLAAMTERRKQNQQGENHHAH